VLVPDVSIKYLERVPSRRISDDSAGDVAIAEPLEVVTLIEEVIREPFISIHDARGERVITVIEILMPSNKISASAGFNSYRAKRFEINHSSTHCVEIDLLRAGNKMVAIPQIQSSDYYVYVSAHGRRPKGWIWPILLPQSLPEIKIPLGEGDPPVALDLQQIVTAAYERSYYESQIDYAREPVPPLPPHYAQWADELL
jgi:hypothetical protein